MMRTASIRLDTTAEHAGRLAALQVAYADACNRLVPIVRERRLYNRECKSKSCPHWRDRRLAKGGCKYA
ncbi:hypothetical protein [Aquaspirillum soli]